MDTEITYQWHTRFKNTNGDSDFYSFDTYAEALDWFYALSRQDNNIDDVTIELACLESSYGDNEDCFSDAFASVNIAAESLPDTFDNGRAISQVHRAEVLMGLTGSSMNKIIH